MPAVIIWPNDQHHFAYTQYIITFLASDDRSCLEKRFCGCIFCNSSTSGGICGLGCRKKRCLKRFLLDAHDIFAFVLFEEGKFQEALNHCDEAIRLNPYYAYAYNSRGNAFAKIGNHQQAIEDYNKVIRMESDYAVDDGKLIEI